MPALVSYWEGAILHFPLNQYKFRCFLFPRCGGMVGGRAIVDRPAADAGRWAALLAGHQKWGACPIRFPQQEFLSGSCGHSLAADLAPLAVNDHRQRGPATEQEPTRLSVEHKACLSAGTLWCIMEPSRRACRLGGGAWRRSGGGRIGVGADDPTIPCAGLESTCSLSGIPRRQEQTCASTGCLLTKPLPCFWMIYP